MKFLIAGLGSIGRRHLRNLQALGERDILLFRTHQSTLPDSELKGFPVFTDLRLALAERPDAVVVSNPTALHLDVALPAARAGCHLLLEKPVSHTLDRLQELQQVMQANRVQALVGHQYRFHPALRQLKERLDQGAIGRLLSARAVYAEYLPEMHPWEDYHQGYGARRDLGGGVILTLCHPIDALRWLLGDVDELWAFAGSLNDYGLDVVDTAELGLQFSSRALGSIHLDYNRRPRQHSLEITGSNGVLRWDDASNCTEWFDLEHDRWETLPAPIGFFGGQNFERNDMFLAEIKHFRDLVSGQTSPVCTLADGIQSLKVALAAHHSASSGERVRMYQFSRD